jgi:hypothetical protein
MAFALESKVALSVPRASTKINLGRISASIASLASTPGSLVEVNVSFVLLGNINAKKDKLGA